MPPRLRGVHSLRTERVRAISAAPISSEPPTFSPADIASLHFWLNAETGTTTGSAAEGGLQTSQWTDAETGKYASQATAANRPILLSNQVNGRPLMMFSNNDKWMSTSETILTASVAPASPQAFTIFVACSLTGYFHVFSNLAGTSYFQLGAATAFQNLSTTPKSLDTLTIPADMAIYALWYDGNNTVGNNNAILDYYKNGTRVLHDTGGYVASCSFETLAKFGNNAIWANAKVGEIVVFDAALDLTPGGDFDTVQDYLTERWM